MFHPNDKYTKRAKKEGYRARSVFKLIQIDKKFKLLKPGDTVLDLGAAPGSWLQYIRRRVGRHGLVIGIDQEPITPLPFKNVKIFLNDISAINKLNNLPSNFDLVLSDLAPATSGTKFADSAKSLELLIQAFYIAKKFLKNGGHFVGKVFVSEELNQFFDKFSKSFTIAKRYKPHTCRDSSKELYFIGKKFKK